MDGNKSLDIHRGTCHYNKKKSQECGFGNIDDRTIFLFIWK